MRLVFLNTLDAEVPALREFIETEKQNDTLFCFQEAYARMEALGRELLPEYAAVSAAGQREGEDPFRNVVYVPASCAAEASGAIPGAYAQWVVLHSKGSLIYLANVHDTSQPWNKEDTPQHIGHAKALVEFFDAKTPVIIGGDFNLLPHTESISLFGARGYRDLIRECNVTTTRPQSTVDKYEVKLYFSDYVFTKGVAVKDFHVPAIEVSDHLPLIVEIDA